MIKQLPYITVFFVVIVLMCSWNLDNPSDSHSSNYTVKSEALLTIKNNGPFYQFDTITFSGGVSSKPIEDEGLIKRYNWDIGNDGNIDSQFTGPATLNVFAKNSGPLSVSLNCIDELGHISEDIKTIDIIPRFRLDVVLPDIGLNLDTTCAFYSQNQYTMRPVILLGRYLTYRNKSESLATGTFTFELLKNLTGTLDVNTLSLPYKKSFNNGVYTLSNGEFTMSAAFLYGSAISGHQEDDTIKYDLFDYKSYVKSITSTVNPPYYKLEKGPLWDLAGNFTVNINPLNPTVSFSIPLEALKFCGTRIVSSRYMLSTELTDSNLLQTAVFDNLFFRYNGIARIKPVHIRDIISITGKDSLLIDMSGSEIISDSFTMEFAIPDKYDTTKVGFRFQLNQKMLNHVARFGNSEEKYKVHVTYSAQSALSVNEYSLVKSYFTGVSATNSSDTAKFFCDYDMSNQFGELLFDQPDKGELTFISERYSYQFILKEGTIKEL